jgi:hypothetical protein
VDEDVDFFSAFSVDQLQDDLSPPKAGPASRKPLGEAASILLLALQRWARAHALPCLK